LNVNTAYATAAERASPMFGRAVVDRLADIAGYPGSLSE
jgi:hypothetical protein